MNGLNPLGKSIYNLYYHRLGEAGGASSYYLIEEEAKTQVGSSPPPVKWVRLKGWERAVRWLFSWLPGVNSSFQKCAERTRNLVETKFKTVLQTGRVGNDSLGMAKANEENVRTLRELENRFATLRDTDSKGNWASTAQLATFREFLTLAEQATLPKKEEEVKHASSTPSTSSEPHPAIAQLEAEKEMVAKLTGQLAESTTIAQELATSKATVERLTQELETSTSRVQSLEEQVKEHVAVSTERDRLEQELVQERESVQKLTQELESVQVELTTRNQTLEMANGSLTEENTRLKTAAQQAAEEKAKLEEQLKKHQDQVERLARELHGTIETNQSLEEELRLAKEGSWSKLKKTVKGVTTPNPKNGTLSRSLSMSRKHSVAALTDVNETSRMSAMSPSTPHKVGKTFEPPTMSSSRADTRTSVPVSSETASPEVPAQSMTSFLDDPETIKD